MNEMKVTVAFMIVGVMAVWYYRQKTKELLPTWFGVKRKVVKFNQRAFGHRLHSAALKGVHIMEQLRSLVG